jgi:hypothetical protein
MRVTAVALSGAAGGRQVALAHPSSDFNQQEFSPAAIADGNPKTGWAIWPDVARPHQAIWEFAEDVGAGGGTLLAITIDQGWGDGHVLGRFRLSVTSSPRPVRFAGLPDDLLASLSLPASERTPDQSAALHRAFLSTAPDLIDRQRLAATQDLAWALATSPGFLFNR